MTYHIAIQRRAGKCPSPSSVQLKQWAMHALNTILPSAELTIRLVTKKEMTTLNESFRKKAGPTNVLSFPFEIQPELTNHIPFLGDIIICGSVVNEEAAEQQKPMLAHWAHMVIHGTLHLLGYNHEEEREAETMEALEIVLLDSLGFKNPYQLKEGNSHE